MSKPLTAKESKTVDYYDQNAQNWATKHLDYKFWGPVENFYRLASFGKVLEIGCGGGRDAKDYLIGRYEYTGIDVSEGLLIEARKRNPSGKFYKQSVYELDFPANSFDAFWAAAVLLHVPKYRIDEALSKIREVVKRGGVGFVSVKQGEGEGEDEDGRWFSYYSLDEFSGILVKNGFKVVESNIQQTGKTTWLVCIVRVEK